MKPFKPAKPTCAFVLRPAAYLPGDEVEAPELCGKRGHHRHENGLFYCHKHIKVVICITEDDYCTDVDDKPYGHVCGD